MQLLPYLRAGHVTKVVQEQVRFGNHCPHHLHVWAVNVVLTQLSSGLKSMLCVFRGLQPACASVDAGWLGQQQESLCRRHMPASLHGQKDGRLLPVAAQRQQLWRCEVCVSCEANRRPAPSAAAKMRCDCMFYACMHAP